MLLFVIIDIDIDIDIDICSYYLQPFRQIHTPTFLCFTGIVVLLLFHVVLLY